MHITIIFSSLLHTLAGVEQEDLDIAEGTTIDRLGRLLARKYPDLPLESQKTYYIVNGRISTGNQVLSQGDQVRIFQLLAGG